VFQNRKWNIYTIVLILFCGAIVILEILPRNYELVGNLSSWVLSSSKEEFIKVNDLQITELQNEIALLNKSVSTIASEYNSQIKLSSLYLTFSNFSSVSGAEILDVSPAEMVQENVLWKVPVEIETSGSYEQLFNFLLAIEKSQKVMKVGSVSVTHGRDGKSLIMNLELEVYLNL